MLFVRVMYVTLNATHSTGSAEGSGAWMPRGLVESGDADLRDVDGTAALLLAKHQYNVPEDFARRTAFSAIHLGGRGVST